MLDAQNAYSPEIVARGLPHAHRVLQTRSSVQETQNNSDPCVRNVSTEGMMKSLNGPQAMAPLELAKYPDSFGRRASGGDLSWRIPSVGSPQDL